ncbi:hypothetical protein Q0M94_27425 (plasmid) [Deinococcus radiomollis]|uniref:hypothetical protein n=1 Tax=Deinococcus radiomollis TaxID=468916 RepID=UPI003891AC07
MKNIILITAAFALPFTTLAQTKLTTPMTKTPTRLRGLALKFTAMPGMNMVKSSRWINVTPTPGYPLVTYHMIDHVGTLTYASVDARSLFDFYSNALGSQGWKKRVNLNLDRDNASTYAQSYTMRALRLDLKTTTSGKYTTVLIRTR